MDELERTKTWLEIMEEIRKGLEKTVERLKKKSSFSSVYNESEDVKPTFTLPSLELESSKPYITRCTSKMIDYEPIYLPDKISLSMRPTWARPTVFGNGVEVLVPDPSGHYVWKRVK